VGRNAQEYWRRQDGGIHILATAIYSQYERALYQSPQAYSEWFVHAVQSGELIGNKLQTTVGEFFAGNASKPSK
jgi:hypothetical protein